MLWFLSIGIWLFSGPSPVALEVSPTKEPIQMDGIVNADEWADALVISEWYETNPGDNVPPKVKNIGYITYDDRYFYVGLIMHDPNPERIVAPVADRDQVPSYTDYAGIFLDTADEGRVSQMFLTNPRGVQYDAISGDSSGEDSSPDFFWDVKAQITDQGWNAELRIPFSSLRYNGGVTRLGGLCCIAIIRVSFATKCSPTDFQEIRVVSFAMSCPSMACGIYPKVDIWL